MLYFFLGLVLSLSQSQAFVECGPEKLKLALGYEIKRELQVLYPDLKVRSVLVRLSSVRMSPVGGAHLFQFRAILNGDGFKSYYYGHKQLSDFQGQYILPPEMSLEKVNDKWVCHIKFKEPIYKLINTGLYNLADGTFVSERYKVLSLNSVIDTEIEPTKNETPVEPVECNYENAKKVLTLGIQKYAQYLMSRYSSLDGDEYSLTDVDIENSELQMEREFTYFFRIPGSYAFVDKSNSYLFKYSFSLKGRYLGHEIKISNAARMYPTRYKNLCLFKKAEMKGHYPLGGGFKSDLDIGAGAHFTDPSSRFLHYFMAPAI